MAFRYRTISSTPQVIESDSILPADVSAEDQDAEEFDFLATPDWLQNPENHNLQLEIISPEGETIFPAQARMYNAMLTGNAKYEMAFVNCNWKFYLNERDQEALFRELDNRSVLSQPQQEVCGFTNTFIDKIGTLRIELTADLTNIAGETLESVTATRDYVVNR